MKNNFICPVDKARLTSKFGYRTIDGQEEWHQGVDLAGPTPNVKVPVYASASGRVKKAGPLSSYGNRVLITHTIGGKTYETNYAHLDSWMVKEGQTVKQGQQIGIMGRTGRSYGVHLHFEIHNGLYAPSQPNAVDPMKYIRLTDNPSTINKVEEIETEDNEVMKFTNDTFKNAVRDFIDQSVKAKYIDAVHLKNFDNGTMTSADYEGLKLIVEQRKIAKK